MSQKEFPRMVEEMVTPIAQELGLEVVDVEFVKEGPHWYLRVFLDKDGGLEIEDCSMVSNQLSQLLDEKDPIPQAYMLEVSSPGLERPLKKKADFQKYAGRQVSLKTFVPVEGKKEISGKLIGLIDDQVIVEIDGSELKLPLNSLASVRLEIAF